LDKNSQVLNIKSLPAEGLRSWLSKESAARGMALDAPALTALAGSGQDMYYLQNLLDKLSLINFPGSIGIKELEEHLDSRHSIKVFKLTDALLNRNLNESLQAFYQLQEQGEHPLFMLYMISRQLLSLAKVKAYKGMGQSVQEIAGRLGQKDFAVKNMLKKSSNFSQEDIRRLFQRLLETDKSFKSEGKPADILMETLIIEFCRPNN
jgi:DNA polymerase-3 subunit delta